MEMLTKGLMRTCQEMLIGSTIFQMAIQLQKNATTLCSLLLTLTHFLSKHCYILG